MYSNYMTNLVDRFTVRLGDDGMSTREEVT